MSDKPKGRVGILISGRGSNMEAIADACKREDFPAEVGIVVSNEPDASGLQKARVRRIEAQVIDHRASRSREEHHKRIHAIMSARQGDLIWLAGYKRILSPWLASELREQGVELHARRPGPESSRSPPPSGTERRCSGAEGPR